MKQWFKDLENSSDLETIAMNNKISLETIKHRINDFRPKAELSYPTYARFFSHFKNFVAKTKNEPIKKTIAEL